jgi:hypothetical protein
VSIDPLLVGAIITTVTWVGFAALGVSGAVLTWVLGCAFSDEVRMRRMNRKAKAKELLDRAIIAEAYRVVEREYTQYLRERARDRNERRDHE